MAKKKPPDPRLARLLWLRDAVHLWLEATDPAIKAAGVAEPFWDWTAARHWFDRLEEVVNPGHLPPDGMMPGSVFTLADANMHMAAERVRAVYFAVAARTRYWGGDYHVEGGGACHSPAPNEGERVTLGWAERVLTLRIDWAEKKHEPAIVRESPNRERDEWLLQAAKDGKTDGEMMAKIREMGWKKLGPASLSTTIRRIAEAKNEPMPDRRGRKSDI
jgi:hypothetical protein